MANLQIKDLPADLHGELRRRAEQAGTSVRGYVIELIRRDQALPSSREWLERLERLEPVEPGLPVAEILRAGRDQRLGNADSP